MTNIVTFSGWGQPHDSLAEIAPNANHIKYNDFANIEDLFSSLKQTKCDVLIGWSLGGQLALRAIDADILKPKLLVLIATPFQFLKSKTLRCGMDTDTFNSFENDLRLHPHETMDHFGLLIAKNDSNLREIRTRIKQGTRDDPAKWLPWLDELRNFSGSKLNFAKMPTTLSIHGRSDTLVDASQTGIFHPLIDNYKSVIFEECGHAPHLHDSAKVKELINELI